MVEINKVKKGMSLIYKFNPNKAKGIRIVVLDTDYISIDGMDLPVIEFEDPEIPNGIRCASPANFEYINKPTNYIRETTCFRCGEKVNSATMPIHDVCGWIVCAKCKSCGCSYLGNKY